MMKFVEQSEEILSTMQMILDVMKAGPGGTSLVICRRTRYGVKDF